MRIVAGRWNDREPVAPKKKSASSHSGEEADSIVLINLIRCCTSYGCP